MRSRVLKRLAAAVAMTCAFGVAQAAEPVAPKTNVLLIMADDAEVEAFGTCGGTSYKTHNIDALARRGVQFTNAHTYPLCTPTRAALLTGQHNFRNYQAFGWLDPAETTFAEVLRSNGYATAIAGKW
jgi:arylsulfatase A